MMMKIVGVILEIFDLLDLLQLVKTAVAMKWMGNIVFSSIMNSRFPVIWLFFSALLCIHV